MKNGGMLGRAGSLLLVTAAKTYSVPVIIVASIFKLTPHFPFEQNTFNEILNPKEVYIYILMRILYRDYKIKL
jgi:translation initiation factor eIF-2B subunit beta